MLHISTACDVAATFRILAPTLLRSFIITTVTTGTNTVINHARLRYLKEEICPNVFAHAPEENMQKKVHLPKAGFTIYFNTEHMVERMDGDGAAAPRSILHDSMTGKAALQKGQCEGCSHGCCDCLFTYGANM